MLMRTTISQAVVTVALSTIAQAANVIHVNPTATGANDGSSWADAFTDLQDALVAAAPGMEIWAAAGVYTPGPPEDAVSSFVLKSGVALYGGFAGAEETRDQRDWRMNATVLSGDVGRDDVYGAGVWYLGWNRNTANSGHVVVGSGVDSTAALDGFVITAGATGPNGTPANSEFMYGGGLYNINGSPTVRNCTFTRNLAAFGPGAAIYNYDSSPTITNCTFKENYVHLGHGAGVFNGGSSSPAISDCTFADNLCNGGQPEAAGAGISNYFTPPITVERCTFERNVVANGFGGVYPAYGGAIENLGTALTVRNCVFRGNVANSGGAINTFAATTVINSLFVDNRAASYDIGGGLGVDGIGGAITNLGFGEVQTLLINCTIVANRANEGGGVFTANGHRAVLRNTIVWANVATGEEVSPRDAQYKGATDVLYNCVQDLLTPVPGEDPPNPADYPGSTGADPLFVDLATRDCHLRSTSPSVDSGDPTFAPPPMLDLDGLDRVRCGRVDMGAYEFGVGDLTCDRILGSADFTLFGGCMAGPDGAIASTCEDADFDASGHVDLRDFGVLQRAVADW